MKKNLVITNYDNFKDLSYFIGQHKIALGMLDEVEKFYLAFLKSKLIYSLDISKYPGKIIKKTQIFKDTIDIDTKYNADIFDTVKAGDHIDNYTVIKVGKIQKFFYNNHKHRLLTIRYDDDAPKVEYINLFNAISDEINLCGDLSNLYYPEEEEYNNQAGIKKELENTFIKNNNKFYCIVKPTGEIIYFCKEDDLTNFKFTLSENSSKLIVYRDIYTGGTETEQWKTYSYEGYNHITFTFEVFNGNFIEKNTEFIYTRRTLLKGVHNGWHPYDDD